MAITIQDQPATSGNGIFYPVGNPVEFLVSSSLSTAPNFKIECKVYLPYAATTPLATLRYDIIPGTTQILFDAHKILQSQFTESITNLRTSAVGCKVETTKQYDAKVTFGESYGAIPSVTGSPTTSNIIRLWNGVFKYKGWQTEAAKYKIQTDSTNLTKKVLTNFDNGVSVAMGSIVAAPSSYFRGQYNLKKMTSTQLAQLTWLWKTVGSATRSKIVIYAFKSDFSSYTSGTTDVAASDKVISCNISLPLLAAFSGSLTLDSTYKYMAIYISDETYQVSQSYLFEIDWTPCSRFDSYEIHWLNRQGGFDSWIFNKRSRRTTEIERQSYNPTFLPISGSSIVRNSYDITGKNFIVSTKEQYLLNSSYLKAWELEGLEDLITSPLVYWNSADGFVNIAIKDPNVFEHKTNTVDKLFNLSFAFEIDNQDRRQ